MDPVTQNRSASSNVPQTLRTTVPPEREPGLGPRLQARMKDWRSSTEDYIRREPVKAIFIALVAGVVVGKAIHALFGARPRKRTPVERVIIRTPRELKEWPA